MAKAKTKKVSGKGKIWLLAVDPFAGFDLSLVTHFALTTAKSSGAEIHAAYVLAPAGLNWTGDFSGPWFKRYQPIAQEKLDLVLDQKIPRKILLCKQAGQHEAARILLGYAKRIKAETILISTHARRGLQRMAMGSFAETLIEMSKIPVMVTNPSLGVPVKVRRILVPTDLSANSAKDISAIADYAKQLDAEIVLYYKQSDPLDPIVQQGVYSLGGGWVSIQTYIDEELTEKTQAIEKIEGMLRRKKVPVSHVMDSAPGNLVEAIDRAARETNSDMISVVGGQNGWMTRGLVRHSSVPILVR